MLVDWPEGIGFEAQQDGSATIGNPGPWLWDGVLATDGTPADIEWAKARLTFRAQWHLTQDGVPSDRWQIAVKAFPRPTGQAHVHCLYRDAGEHGGNFAGT